MRSVRHRAADPTPPTGRRLQNSRVNRCDPAGERLSDSVCETVALDQLQHRGAIRKFFNGPAEVIVGGFLPSHDRGEERQATMQVKPICGTKGAGWDGKIENKKMP